ncbi:site-specific recombinase [Acinetobacter variabilis]|uniref:Site-specific recombinase n=2 Tax=Acinetobacter variabilis TaxID=70346 RepID=A0A7T7WGQ2_9GAMM|nr:MULTISPECIES: site-specific recombinase [Acinetobacter]NHB65271.1 site-specific recombinase [Acinetobacter sp. GFQ9D191M]NHC00727.1 site-specific recombinase [Acinetobacter sp. GFQ9D192M]QQN87426.1 site-specific recombinase [Acinetobacter variabilis]WKT74011.1 site-specific recombinase [Acinetobacter variabilis]WPC34169.1 site-specific recombinase [Acinetobacter sp. YWS30-1]
MHINFLDIFQSMQHQLEQPQAVLDENLLIQLVERIRPEDSRNTEEIETKFNAFIRALLLTPNAVLTLQSFTLRVINRYKQASLFSDTGILSLDGFWNQLNQRIGAHILPVIPDHLQLQELFRKIFYLRTDKYWLDYFDEADWQRLFAVVNQGHSNQVEKTRIKDQIIKALTILSYRVSGIGLHPEFINAQPELMEYESPFLVQNREIIEFIQEYKKRYNTVELVDAITPPDASQALVMLEQCHDVVAKIRRSTKRIGVSVSLTYMLALLEQCLERIEILLNMVLDDDDLRYQSIGLFIADITEAIYSERSVRALLTTNSELLALQVTENASKTGEHYVSTDKQGFLAMYKSAAGAGVIIAFMASLKVLMARVTMAPLMQAFSYSMNYSLGFMLIHVLHFTVATKQPAMTAAALASTVQQRKGSKTAQIAELAALIVNIIRTQFVAILGNISIAIPVAALIALMWEFALHEPLMTHAKAAKTLYDLNPFTSLAIPHAAVAGVCLFLSGLLAGYFDNMAVYRKVGPRLRAHVRLSQLMGQERLHRFADYIERNLGALAGNFIFGVMLGSMGTIGFILGLPLDIRHIAFASANFIQGLININGPDIGLIIISFLGVLLIGLTNLFVSFSLTIIVALRARRVRFEQWKPLAKLVMTHFLTRPSEFFWPPKQTIEIDENHTSTKL